MTRELDEHTIEGRVDECARIDALLEGLGAGTGGGLQLVGEPGTGKTTLLAWARMRAGAAMVLETAGAEGEAPLSYGALADLVRGLGDALPALPAHGRDALLGVSGLAPSRGEPDALALGSALMQALELAAAERPVLVVVDDAQWLDAASAPVLTFALRRLAPEPVGVLVGARPGPHRLDALALPELRLRGLGDERRARAPSGRAASARRRAPHRRRLRRQSAGADRARPPARARAPRRPRAAARPAARRRRHRAAVRRAHRRAAARRPRRAAPARPSPNDRPPQSTPRRSRPSASTATCLEALEAAGRWSSSGPWTHRRHASAGARRRGGGRDAGRAPPRARRLAGADMAAHARAPRLARAGGGARPRAGPRHQPARGARPGARDVRPADRGAPLVRRIAPTSQRARRSATRSRSARCSCGPATWRRRGASCSGSSSCGATWSRSRWASRSSRPSSSPATAPSRRSTRRPGRRS